ncbi:MAG: PKD domain-containing protein [Sumerlaeia bacterium]
MSLFAPLQAQTAEVEPPTPEFGDVQDNLILNGIQAPCPGRIVKAPLNSTDIKIGAQNNFFQNCGPSFPQTFAYITIYDLSDFGLESGFDLEGVELYTGSITNLSGSASVSITVFTCLAPPSSGNFPPSSLQLDLGSTTVELSNHSNSADTVHSIPLGISIPATGHIAVAITANQDQANGFSIRRATSTSSDSTSFQACNGSSSFSRSFNEFAVGLLTCPTVVQNSSPSITSIQEPSSPYNENQLLTFIISFTDANPGDTFSFRADMGNGDIITANNVTSPHSFSYRYLDDNPTGTPEDEVDLRRGFTITDSAGYSDVGGPFSTSIVRNVAPVVNAGGPYATLPNQPVNLSGSFTDVGTLDTHVVEWDLDNDGIYGELGSAASRGNERTLNTTLDTTGLSLGQYIVSLRVTDDDTGVGLSSTATGTVNIVSSLTPVPTISAIPSGREQGPASVVVTFTEPVTNFVPADVSFTRVSSGTGTFTRPITVTQGANASVYTIGGLNNIENQTLGTIETWRLRILPASPGNIRGSFTNNLMIQNPVDQEFTVAVDSILASVEALAPNGDGNNDGIPDEDQGNVASVELDSGTFLTVVAPEGTVISNLVTGSPTLTVPGGVTFPEGVLELEVSGGPVSGTIPVELIYTGATAPEADDFYIPVGSTYSAISPAPTIQENGTSVTVQIILSDN